MDELLGRLLDCVSGEADHDLRRVKLAAVIAAPGVDAATARWLDATAHRIALGEACALQVFQLPEAPAALREGAAERLASCSARWLRPLWASVPTAPPGLVRVLTCHRAMRVAALDACRLLLWGFAEAAVHDVATGARIRALRLNGHDAWHLTVLPGGRHAVTGGPSGRLTRYDLGGVEEAATIDAHDGPVKGIAAHPDGQRVASVGEDGRIRLWAPSGSAPPREMGVEDARHWPTGELTFHPDGRLCVRVAVRPADEASTKEGSAWTYATEVYDVESGARLAVRLDLPTVVGFLDARRVLLADGAALSLRRFDDGARLARYDDARCDAVVHGDEVAQLTGHAARVSRLVTARAGDGVRTASLRLWSRPISFAAVGGPRFAVSEHGAAAVVDLRDAPAAEAPAEAFRHRDHLLQLALSTDGRAVFSADTAGIVHQHDVSTGRHLATLEAPGQWAHVALHPDGRRAVVGGWLTPGEREIAGFLSLWDLDGATMRGSHRFEGDAAVRAIRFLADGSFVVTLGANRTQRWTTSPFEAVAALEGCGGGWAWHPDGDRFFASCADGATALVDAASIRVLRRWEGAGDPCFVADTALVTWTRSADVPYTVSVLDVDTGAVRWRREGEVYGWGMLPDLSGGAVCVCTRRGIERWSLDDGATVSAAACFYEHPTCVWPTGPRALAVWADPQGLVVTPCDDPSCVLARWPDGVDALPLPDGDLIVAERRGALVRLRAEGFAR